MVIAFAVSSNSAPAGVRPLHTAHHPADWRQSEGNQFPVKIELQHVSERQATAADDVTQRNRLGDDTFPLRQTSITASFRTAAQY